MLILNLKLKGEIRRKFIVNIIKLLNYNINIMVLIKAVIVVLIPQKTIYFVLI